MFYLLNTFKAIGCIRGHSYLVVEMAQERYSGRWEVLTFSPARVGVFNFSDMRLNNSFGNLPRITSVGSPFNGCFLKLALIELEAIFATHGFSYFLWNNYDV